MSKFPFYKQHDSMDCGPTCLRMISKYYGRHYTLDTLRTFSGFSREGVSLLGISEAAERVGFHAKGVKLSYQQIKNEVTFPCIIHWGQTHFVVLVEKKGWKNTTWVIADPAKGMLSISEQDFIRQWVSTKDTGQPCGVALLLVPGASFYEMDGEKARNLGWGLLVKHLIQHRKYLVQVFIALLLGSVFQVLAPFLTQNMVDKGLNGHNIGLIYIILVAQFCLFFSRMLVEFIRSRLLLFISTKINLSLLSAFWIKMMRLPMSFFDTKMTGDIMQRINDNGRVESFLTGTALNMLYSTVTLFSLSVALLIYDWKIYAVFITGSALYYLWISIFLKKRRNLNNQSFAISTRENNITMQLVHGMHEIKLSNAEQQKRWEWEYIQAERFKLGFKSLSISQYQQTGAFIINESKNILITAITVKAVVDGYISIGAMMAIQSIAGQLNNPIEMLIQFVQQGQDAKMSLERLNEIHQIEDEYSSIHDKICHLPNDHSLRFENVNFTYAGAGNQPVLKDLNLCIPAGKVTAIVGMSGSGKTTLLKLLLKFYDSYQGVMYIGRGGTGQEHNFRNINPVYWRTKCGSVLQDGYIFSDSIANNISVGDEQPNREKMSQALKVANIQSFIDSLPLGLNTQIGAQGNGISAGQKQRILIARAVYKNPDFLFFDEATNALDSHNERVIMENLQTFFKGKTVVVVAHRLSTVRNADKIIVLEHGRIIEEGTHEDLTRQKNKYYHLVKNQLELGQ